MCTIACEWSIVKLITPRLAQKCSSSKGAIKGLPRPRWPKRALASPNVYWLLALKAGGQGDHDVMFPKFPPTPGNTKVEKGHYTTNAMCKKCAAISHSLPELKKMRCDVAGRGGPNSCKLLVRIRAAIDDKTIPDELKKQFCTTLSWIEPYNAAQGEHDIAALPWPLEQLDFFSCAKNAAMCPLAGHTSRVKMVRSSSGWAPKKASLNHLKSVSWMKLTKKPEGLTEMQSLFPETSWQDMRIFQHLLIMENMTEDPQRRSELPHSMCELWDANQVLFPMPLFSKILIFYVCQRMPETRLNEDTMQCRKLKKGPMQLSCKVPEPNQCKPIPWGYGDFQPLADRTNPSPSEFRFLAAWWRLKYTGRKCVLSFC